MKRAIKERHFSESTGKLHVPCPYREQTGVSVHVVVKDGYCYRSDQCMLCSCKYNRSQSDIAFVLSVTW